MGEVNPLDMLQHILAEPWWLQIWIGWLVAINSASVVFVRERAGRWVLAAWVGNLILMPALFVANGYNRLLGLSHLVCWTPLFVLIYRRRRELLPRGGRFGLWLEAVLLSNAASYVIDVVDVVRYLAGDRS